MGKGDKPVTYEQAHAPHYIAHRKGWLSLHTGGSPRVPPPHPPGTGRGPGWGGGDGGVWGTGRPWASREWRVQGWGRTGHEGVAGMGFCGDGDVWGTRVFWRQGCVGHTGVAGDTQGHVGHEGICGDGPRDCVGTGMCGARGHGVGRRMWGTQASWGRDTWTSWGPGCGGRVGVTGMGPGGARGPCGDGPWGIMRTGTCGPHGCWGDRDVWGPRASCGQEHVGDAGVVGTGHTVIVGTGTCGARGRGGASDVRGGHAAVVRPV